MSPLRSIALVLALTTGLSALPAHGEVERSNVSGDPTYTLEAPPAYAMIGDLIVARPFLIAATLAGTAAFVISLPFTALGGNVKEAGQSLVVAPGREAFVRCLGCTTSGYRQD
ncbi:hypothetical protein SAMN04244572_02437 [Azotobacter beijerinckii]|uniref:Multidrug transporter n=1 Tax=Azotobacter beijerinckii TaxID=170623 RepID=A0A1I4GB65_9GAMM|nr:multidrug transporter [Azotobacter beijerinckii]MDV7212115.1 multidrug transporter [Azotobacter beijerinckii]SEJ01488.1 hypothetical protein SAMN04244572_02437 [Azotobacter beijerinckii]SEJ24800.1 hypothetical protein SAMN04244579_03650 [Azotobacter beijerinckii]SER36569.1 hypothetical protein SAMN04244573_03470 [Azotobacter beijerinckii]SFA89168.1 hypothetical protein SAMN04244571_00690 [Azotobacter beijerinckii]